MASTPLTSAAHGVKTDRCELEEHAPYAELDITVRCDGHAAADHSNFAHIRQAEALDARNETNTKGGSRACCNAAHARVAELSRLVKEVGTGHDAVAQVVAASGWQGRALQSIPYVCTRTPTCQLEHLDGGYREGHERQHAEEQ